MQSYTHILTPVQLRESSKNPWLVDYFATHAAEGATEKSKTITDGMQTLRIDAPRSIKINGQQCPSYIDDGEEKKFEDYLRRELKLDSDSVDAINKSYQQDLLHAAVVPISAHSTIGTLSSEMSFIAVGRSHDLYRDKEDIYLKTIVEFYKIPGDPLRYLPGPVEILHKLDKEKGFVLQHVATNSDILRDVYLGRSINIETVFIPKLLDSPPVASGQVDPEEKLTTALSNILSQLQAAQSKDSDGIIGPAIAAVQSYQAKKLSASELVATLKEIARKPTTSKSNFLSLLTSFSIMGKALKSKAPAETLKQVTDTLERLVSAVPKKQPPGHTPESGPNRNTMT